MRTVTFKKQNGEKIDFITNLTSFELIVDNGITFGYEN